MTTHDFVGGWALCGTAYTSGQLGLVGDGVAPGAREAWLQGTGQDMIDSLEPANGLTLSVSEDGSFGEVGESTATLFDPNGVEVSGDFPYPGVLTTTNDGVWVSTEASVISEPARVVDGPILRVSTDVDVAERFDLVDGRLIRTTNVVTDGVYTTRVVLVYERTEDSQLPAAVAEESPAHAQDDPEIRRLKESIVAGVIDASTVSWERIIVKVEAFHMGAQPKQQSYLTFCVHRGDDGVHRLEQFHVDAVDKLFIALRERIFEVHGKRWGTCVLRIEPPRDVNFDISYEASPMAKGEHVRDDYYQRHLPFFLAERGLDQ